MSDIEIVREAIGVDLGEYDIQAPLAALARLAERAEQAEKALREVRDELCRPDVPSDRAGVYIFTQTTLMRTVKKIEDAILAGADPACVHEWTDMRNEIIVSGEWCPKCGKIRAGNQESANG